MFKNILFLILFLYHNLLFAKSATISAQSLQTVLPCLTIHKESDLNFGEAPQGDSPKTILPGNSENAENSSFEIQGDSGTAFTLVLPQNNTVKMTTPGTGVQTDIAVNEFKSNFGQNPTTQATVGSNGKTMLYVGATRAQLNPRQKPGRYSGTFTVSIIY